MALNTGRVQVSLKGRRAGYETTYMRSRANLLWVVAFTLINIVSALCGLDSYFLFSAIVPYFVALIGRAGFDEYGSSAILIIAGVIAVVMLGVYFLFWCMAKKHRGWMHAATVCFGLDCVALMLLVGMDFSMLFNYLFHVYVMYYLVTGSIAAHKLAKMPPEEPIVASADDVQTVEDAPAETAPVAVEEAPAEELAEQAPAEEAAEEIHDTATDTAEEGTVSEGLKDYRGQTISANYYRGLEAVGGKLAFDDLGMTFRSHALNIQTGETRIEYKDIDFAQIRGMLTEISVFTKDGQDHRFVVYHRKDVVAFLESVKG